ncbi:hypothetical protein F53441_9460 [Fusarium austroafricanum]|uniref:Major facilitator superfamily (MFS) profile domain-containing protein n=1 Tax=Fusarium austroafricanum TaxID=2364996 RepID=A0A8H4KBT4_9HYPO|nr:hypothetical protein F53441_9460 [Fusarium austroafricanum]
MVSLESRQHSLSSPTSDDDTQIKPDTETQPQGSSTPDFGPAPDGGLEAWSVVAGGFFAVFASFGWINCIGIFQDYYSQNQLKNYSSSSIAWIPSVESFMLFFWGPVVGKMTDELGPRWPILLGTFLHVFGLMMTSISKEYYQIMLSQSICSALGCSFLFYAPIAAVGTWFTKRRATAFGIITAGSSLGGVVLPIMVDHLVRSIGFGWAMRSVAFLFLGLLAIANLTIKSRLPPPRRKFNPKDFVTPFKEPPFTLLTIGAFILYLGSFLPFNFIIVQAKALGVSPGLAQYMVPIVNAASTFGRLIPAYIGDKIGVFNVMIPVTALGGIFTLTVWLTAHSTAGVIVFAVLYGFTSGCTLSIIPAMVASFSDVRSIGTRNGALYGVSAIGVLVGSPIAGAIVADQGGHFSGLIIFCGVSILVGMVFSAMSRYALAGPDLRKKV